MRIYNRWGQKVYDRNGIEEGWNGYHDSGEKAHSGLHRYVAEIVGENSLARVYKGNIYLIWVESE